MPELPEVETTVRQLQDVLPGRRIVGLDGVDWPRQFVTHAPDDFGRIVVGRQIVAVRRRAKFALIELEGDHVIAVHRKMSGDLILTKTNKELFDETARDPVLAAQIARKLQYTRATFRLDNGLELHFTDPRKFGRIHLYESSAALEAYFDSIGLGVEPLADGFDEATFVAALAARRGRIKSLLLGQTIVVGLGNIYCDEALFRAKIHPLRAAESLSQSEAAALYAAIRAVLDEAVASKGTTFSGYIDAFGRKGSYQFSLAVYPAVRQKKSDPPQVCRTCGTVIAHDVIGGRTAHYCPTCQVAPTQVA